MHSGRTLQLLPQPHTHFHHHIPSTRCRQLLPSPRMHVCVCVFVLGRIQEIEVWMSHFEQHSTGRSESSQIAFWDIIQPPTQQMHWVDPSPSRLSRSDVVEKLHLEFAVYFAFLNSAISLWVFCLYCSFFYFQCHSACQYLEIPASSLSEVSEAV